MADDVTARVENAPQFRRALRKAGSDLADLKDANQAAAQLVAEHARSTAPRRTGALAATVKGNRAGTKATVRAGSSKVLYANPIHWGWPKRHITANPWISRAAQDTQAIWIGEYQKNVQKILNNMDTQ